MESIGILFVPLVLLLLVLAVLWFFLPFAVFGIKDHLTKLIKLQEQTNKLLAERTR